MSEWISKRQAQLRHGLNARHLVTLIESGDVQARKAGRRTCVSVASLDALVEGTHYVVCRCCGAWVAAITSLHLQACASLDLDGYRTKYPKAPLACATTTVRRRKSPEQKAHQSRAMLEHFQSPEGVHTRLRIAQTSRERMQEGTRRAEFIALNQTEGRRQAVSAQSLERWQEGGDLREAVLSWHASHPEQSRQSAAHARTFIQATSQLHLNFKAALVRNGVQDLETEYAIGYYTCDEVQPEMRKVLEIHG